MNEELKDALAAMQTTLEGKSKEQVTESLEAFAVKMKEDLTAEQKSLVDAEIKSVKESLEAKLKEVQDHADALDVKLQKGKKMEGKSLDFVGGVKSLIKENIDTIGTVRKGKTASIESKDMTLAGNLVGDQPRQYDNVVVPVTSPLINFVDVFRNSISLSGGTFTYPKENAKTGDIAMQIEGEAKSAIEYNVEMVDETTDFLAGVTTYSKKMANNLPFLQSFVPNALRRDYLKAENAKFYTELVAQSVVSTQTIADKTEVEMIMNDIAALETLDNPVDTIVISPASWWKIAATQTSGGGFDLPGLVSFENGNLYINGIMVYKATWIETGKYLVGDSQRVHKLVTEGLSLEFSAENKDNFEKNNITARIEAQIGLCISRNTAFIIGDFAAV